MRIGFLDSLIVVEETISRSRTLPGPPGLAVSRQRAECNVGQWSGRVTAKVSASSTAQAMSSVPGRWRHARVMGALGQFIRFHPQSDTIDGRPGRLIFPACEVEGPPAVASGCRRRICVCLLRVQQLRGPPDVRSDAARHE
jgi:hypothetical protein